ncbi:unnamed protein product [Miscanthus lutarioriparius]|uniref:2,4-dienoyl-CoA reductase [(3E)-enoyl-CoA-producing] n=1 Tax=Miscanthus lutarioriparius TaxID=422564 RepID=A0A811RPL9_9POAL|nr:unnamed protein product [Miscanthus lutarioriparius]
MPSGCSPSPLTNEDSFLTLTLWVHTQCVMKPSSISKGWTRERSFFCGLIINISATLQYTAAWYQIHVSSNKAGVDSIIRLLTLEWGTDYDIRVNGIAHGPIQDTPGMRKLAPEEMGKGKQETMPLFKLGDKWEIAMAALYLASDADVLPDLVHPCFDLLTKPFSSIVALHVLNFNDMARYFSSNSYHFSPLEQL